MSAVRTFVVTNAVCWRPGCGWHATGTDANRLDNAADLHTHVEVERSSFPLTTHVDRTVDFHSCEAFDKDGPATPGASCERKSA